MGLPIRITFRENADHFIDAQSQYPQSTRPLVRPKTQNLFLVLLVIGALAYALWDQYRKGAQIKFLVMAGLFVVVVMLFWMWFFKKIGLYKDGITVEREWTEKDEARIRNVYIKKTGQEEAMVACVFDENGFQIGQTKGVARRYEWSSIRRVAERPKGVFIFIGRWTYFWLSKTAFDSEETYRELLELLQAKVKECERLNTAKLVIISLGSNLGDSKQMIRRAMAQLQNHCDATVFKSSLWQSTPVDCPPGSPMFVNAIAAFEPRADETPESLLEKLQLLEKESGRKPKQVLNEPRSLDLDLIAFGHATRRTQQLVLPHPRAHQRRFVLQPLSEIAPNLVLPGQSKTVMQLLNDLPPDDGLTKLT